MRTAACLTALLSMLMFSAPASAVLYTQAPTPSYEAPIERAPAHEEAIVVPLTDGAFSSIVDTRSHVKFDFAGAGDKRAKGWLTSDAAWLVWDPNWRGDVQSGVDMIGAHSWSALWRNGFEALQTLDRNHDGQLTGAELGGLALWRDANGDGISTPDEVIPVQAHGIVSIATHGANARPGLITAPGGVRFDNGASRPLYDWTPSGRTRVS